MEGTPSTGSSAPVSAAAAVEELLGLQKPKWCLSAHPPPAITGEQGIGQNVIFFFN